jgi:peptide/nickel transport system permease protein
LFILRRIARVTAVLITITFAVYYLVLGFRDPVGNMLGEVQTPEARAFLTQQLGLDKPIVVQYWNWLTAALRGDLGESIRTNQPVAEIIAQRIMPTVQLSLYALVLAVAGGLVIGILAARSNGKWADHVLGTTSLVGIAIPNFALGLLFVLLFAVTLDWLPPSGYVPPSVNPVAHIEFMVLPVLALALEILAVVTRLVRTSSIETLNSPLVIAARAHGVKESTIMRRYVARSAAVPVMTFVGMRIGLLLGGAVVIETVFSIPGLGSLAAASISQADYPVVLGVVLFVGVIVACANVLVDILYRVVDPRAK